MQLSNNVLHCPHNYTIVMLIYIKFSMATLTIGYLEVTGGDESLRFFNGDSPLQRKNFSSRDVSHGQFSTGDRYVSTRSPAGALISDMREGVDGRIY